MPVISKRLNARYDWLTTRWSQKSYQLFPAGDGCSHVPSVAGAVAWLSEGNCSFFTKVCSCVHPNSCWNIQLVLQLSVLHLTTLQGFIICTDCIQLTKATLLQFLL